MGVDFGVTEAIAIGGLVASAASTGAAVIGQQSAARAQSENAAYQAQVAKNNQIIASQNAQYAIQAGQAKAADEALKNRAKEGAVLTGEASSGLDVNSGTPLAVEQTQREADSLGTLRVMDAAQLQAYGYRTQATNFGAESTLQSAESGQATTAGDLSAAGGLIGGASSTALNYDKLRLAGLPNSTSTSPTVSTAYGGVPTFPTNSNDF